MADVLQAALWAREGKKVTRPNWEKGRYICLKNGSLVDEKGEVFNSYQYTIAHLFIEGVSKDWEIYEEPLHLCEDNFAFCKEYAETALSNRCLILSPWGVSHGPEMVVKFCPFCGYTIPEK